MGFVWGSKVLEGKPDESRENYKLTGTEFSVSLSNRNTRIPFITEPSIWTRGWRKPFA